MLACDREYSGAEYSQLAGYQGRTPVNLMTIGERHMTACKRFAQHFAELRSFTAKNLQTVEDGRERFGASYARVWNRSDEHASTA